MSKAESPNHKTPDAEKKALDKHIVKLELTEAEYKELQGHAADSNIPTKTYSEFVMRNLLREAKAKPKESFLKKLKNLKNLFPILLIRFL